MNRADTAESVRVSLLQAAGPINNCIFTEDLLQLASFKQGPQHVIDQFSTVCKQTGMKISSK